MEEIKHMNLESEDLVADRIERLRELFPEVATEGNGSIDFEKLRLILGDEVDEGDERYAFTWPGKTDAIRQAQTVSTATLRPCPEKSVDWDTTQNLYIEGDNLEVLKLLQRGYHGRVKLIYIDPPYNTGHDFVYHDSFGDSVENYRKQAGLSSQSNADTSGRYHSNWCSMMYPRLKLARELLSDDGVIFISIDDNELFNLHSLCNELFGENNYIALLSVENNPKGRKNSKYISVSNEYCLIFGKDTSKSFFRESVPKPLSDLKLDDDGRYVHTSGKRVLVGENTFNRIVTNSTSAKHYSVYYSKSTNQLVKRVEQTPNVVDASLISKGYKRYVSLRDGAFIENTYTFEKLLELFRQNALEIREDKIYERNLSTSIRLKSLLTNRKYIGVSNNEPQEVIFDFKTTSAAQYLKKLFNTDAALFDAPKNVNYIDTLLSLIPQKDYIVLDFFSGSATTAEAVMKQNLQDDGCRHFIMVQLPEVTAEDSEAYKASYLDLCELGEERIRRAGRKIAEEVEEANRHLKLGEEPKEVPDIGFRVLKLDDSGIERPEPGQLMLDRVKPDRTDEDTIFEMMLKWGIELTYPIEKTEIGGYPCYSVAGDALICCMHGGLTVEAIQAIADRLPSRVLMLDSVLDDTLKLNAVQIFKHAEEKNQMTIDLRTV